MRAARQYIERMEGRDMATDTDRKVTARAKAFSTQGIREHRFLVDADGTVRVWDDIAGHYTLCHALSPAAERRIRRLARA